MLVSRPFLLYSILRREQLHQNSYPRSFEEFSDVCIDAARQSMFILQKMMKEQTLSSLLISDFYFVLDLIQILLLAFALRGSQDFLHQASECLQMLKSMSLSGYCQRMFPETLGELREWGVLSGHIDKSSALQNQEISGVEMGPENGLYDAYVELP